MGRPRRSPSEILKAWLSKRVPSEEHGSAFNQALDSFTPFASNLAVSMSEELVDNISLWTALQTSLSHKRWYLDSVWFNGSFFVICCHAARVSLAISSVDWK